MERVGKYAYLKLNLHVGILYRTLNKMMHLSVTLSRFFKSIFGASALFVEFLGVKAKVDPLLACFLTCVILKFTPGATPADCIEVSEPFHFTYKQIKHWGFKPTTGMA